MVVLTLVSESVDEKPVKASPLPKQTQRVSKKTEGNRLRKLETRRKLIAAARKLFSEVGYDETMPNDIATLAGVAHGTFYFHFEDKLDCFLAFTDEAAYEFSVVHNWFFPDKRSPEEMIRSLLRSTFDYSEANPGVVAAVLTDLGVMSRTERYKKKLPAGGTNWADLLDDWKQTGEAAPDCDRQVFTYMLMGALLRGTALVTRHPERKEQVISNLTKLLTRMIRG